MELFEFISSFFIGFVIWISLVSIILIFFGEKLICFIAKYMPNGKKLAQYIVDSFKDRCK